ncbi:hypothetical protein ACRAR1_29505 [Streptomyces sanyensis]|uniref:hypothetical protein n=1 Tax=Streptomyces sanyensis TaxID=568869 RepID=UPI003D771836
MALLILHRSEIPDETALPAGYRRLRAADGLVQVRCVGEEPGLEAGCEGSWSCRRRR